MHLLVVDIASPEESGARQKRRPVVLHADEFFAAADGAEERESASA